jgi:hypothetical protein
MGDLTQLILVTIVASSALGFLIRRLWPTRSRRPSGDMPSCPNCASSTPCADATASPGR